MTNYAMERCCLLNALRYHQSRPKDEVLGWMKQRWNRDAIRVVAAASELRLHEKVIDGKVWWERPSNLAPLWWYRGDVCPCR